MKKYAYLVLACLLIGGLANYANANSKSTTTPQATTTTKTAPTAQQGTTTAPVVIQQQIKAPEKKAPQAKYVDFNKDTLSINDLKKIEDESSVTLSGHIVKRVNSKKFVLEDPSGQIFLKTDKDTGKQLEKLDATKMVEVYGKFDKKHKIEKSIIEVQKVNVIK